MNSDPSLELPSFTEPSIPTVPSIEAITAPQNQSDAQRRQQASLDTIADVSNDLAGEPSFRAQQEQQMDISGKRQTVNDLTNRFNTLQAQADAIPLRIQEEFEGRGATTAGLQPIETGRLREVAIQQLGVSAALNAAKGRAFFCCASIGRTQCRTNRTRLRNQNQHPDGIHVSPVRHAKTSRQRVIPATDEKKS